MSNLPKGWTFRKLREIDEFDKVQSGFSFKSELFNDNGLPIIRIGNIQDNEIDLKDLVYFNPDDYYNSFEDFVVNPGDLLIAMSGATTGKVAINQTEKVFYLNQRVGNIKINAEITRKYVFHYLNFRKDDNRNIALGAAQPNISTKQIHELKIPIPPNKTYQRLIVKVLDHAHKIIKEREAAIKLCEQLVEAAFYEMFGDPVRNEKKLKLEPLSKNIELNYGKALKKDDRVASGNFPVYGSNGIVGFHDNYIVEDQTIIVGRKGSCGELHLTEKSCYPIDTTFFVTLKEKFIWEFLYMAMSQIPKEQYIRTAGVPGINRNDYLNAKIIVVSEEEQLTFKQIFDSNKKMIKSLQEALELEKQQFQALLQAAFEGRLTAHLDGEDD